MSLNSRETSPESQAKKIAKALRRFRSRSLPALASAIGRILVGSGRSDIDAVLLHLSDADHRMVKLLLTDGARVAKLTIEQAPGGKCRVVCPAGMVKAYASCAYRLLQRWQSAGGSLEGGEIPQQQLSELLRTPLPDIETTRHKANPKAEAVFDPLIKCRRLVRNLRKTLETFPDGTPPKLHELVSAIEAAVEEPANYALGASRRHTTENK